MLICFFLCGCRQTQSPASGTFAFLCNLFAHFANMYYLCIEKPKTGRAVCFNPAPRPLLVALSNRQAHNNITENNLKTYFFHCFRFFCLLLCNHFAGLHPLFLEVLPPLPRRLYTKTPLC